MKPTGSCRAWRQLAAPLGLLLIPTLLAGCFGGGQGKVSGQVLYNGKPLPGGWVYFRPVDGRKNLVTAQIDEKGNFEAAVPVGEVKIAVDNTELQPPPANAGQGLGLPQISPDITRKAKSAPPGPSSASENAPPKRVGSYVPIPEKYYNAESSGLSYTVKSGSQTHNIELKKE